MDQYERSSTASTSVDNEELQLFLEKGEADQDSTSKRQRGGWSRCSTLHRVYLVLIHVILVVLVGLLWSRLSQGSLPYFEGVSWSPWTSFIEYEVRGVHPAGHGKVSPFSGPPSPENDAAWLHLLSPSYYSATAEELIKAGESMTNLTELASGGYAASLGVYHELHCLQQMRFWLYKDYYYHDLTESQIGYLHGHLDHCLESLRMTIMCHGNTAMYSFNWNHPTHIKAETQSNAKAVCVKWDNIDAYARTRQVEYPPLIIRVAEAEELA